MQTRLLIVSLLALAVVAAAALLWLRRDAELPQPPSAAPGAAGVVAERQPVVAAGDGGAVDADADRARAAADAAARRAAPVADTSSQPLPDDAQWLDLLLVDQAGEPVPGAEVYWHDASSYEGLDQRRGLGFEQVAQLQHEPERMIRYAGWQTHSDEGGRARVTAGEGGVVAARHDGLYGRMDLRRHMVVPPAGLRLVLTPDRQLRVRVVDDQGQPCAEVPVTLAIVDEHNGYGGPFGWQAMAATDADGLAVIAHLQRYEEMLRSPDWGHARDMPVTVRPCLPGWTERGAEVSLSAPPDEVLLTLPACGSIRVQPRVDGRPAGFRYAELNLADPGAFSFRWVRADDDGWARFQHVPVGRDYTASIYEQGMMRRQVSGPRMRGEQVDVVLEPDAGACLLRGRLFDDDEQPLVDQEFWVQAVGASGRGGAPCRTGADGSFAANLGARDPGEVEVDAGAEPSIGITIECHREHQPALRAELPLVRLLPGVQDLGDVVLAKGALVVAGRVMAGELLHKEEVYFWVQRFDPTATDDDEQWPMVDGTSSTFADGRFAVYGQVGPGRYRLQLAGRSLRAIDPVEFAPGSEDLVVQIGAAVTTAASLLLPDGTPTEQLKVELVASQPQVPGEPPKRFESHLQRVQNARYAAEWCVPPGSYTLEVRAWLVTAPVVRVPDIELATAEGGDSRLVDIDLRAKLRVATVHVFDPEGQPLASSEGAVFLAGQRPEEVWPGTSLSWSPSVQLLLPVGPVELLVAVEGFRPMSTPCHGAEQNVRLEHWPSIAVQLADLPELPEGVAVRMHAVAVDQVERQWRSPWWEGSRSDLMGGRGPAVQVTSPQLTLRHGDGMQRITITVSGPEGDCELAGLTPGQVAPTVQQVTVRVAAGEWQRAFAHVLPKR